MVGYIMEKLVCSKFGCNKVIEGFSKRHVEFLMMQHQLKHRRQDKQSKQKEEIKQ